MHLMAPYWLALFLLPLGAALVFLLKKKKGAQKRQLPFSVNSAEIRKLVRRTRFSYRLQFALTLVAFGLLAFAIARPATYQKWTHKWSEGIDIVITFDVSESMDATDFKPNRMTVAKELIRDFIKRRSSDRIGLVIFGGEAVTKVPLTQDYDFLLRQLADVQMRELKQGTAIGMALANAVGRLQTSTSKTKVVILITDGDSNVGAINPVTAATMAVQDKIKIYSIGIGKNSRVLVPIYAYDAFGNKTHLLTQVPSYLNPELLQDISRRTGGKAYMATSPTSLEQILQEIDDLEKTKVKISPRRRTDEWYAGFAALAFTLLFAGLLLQEGRYWKARPRHAA